MDRYIAACNLTGQTANDFDIQLGGMAKSEVLKTFHDIFPNVEVADQPYGSLIRYAGREFAPGESMHIGYEIFPAGAIGTIDQYWSYNGAKLAGPAFRCNKPNIFGDGNVTNTGSTDVWTQRRFEAEPGAVDLQNDLNPGTTFWNNATLIDQAPIALLAGATAGYAFAHVGAGSYTMMTEVCSDAPCNAGHVSETVFSSVYCTPEPGLLGLVGSAGLAATPKMANCHRRRIARDCRTRSSSARRRGRAGRGRPEPRIRMGRGRDAHIDRRGLRDLVRGPRPPTHAGGLRLRRRA